MHRLPSGGVTPLGVHQVSRNHSPLSGRPNVVALPSAEISGIESLDEICGWLGTFRERLRLANDGERAEFEATLNRLEARYKERRAELS